MSLEGYVQSCLETDPTIIVSEREINGLLVTQIEEDSYLYGTYLRYVIPINENMALVFACDYEDAPFVDCLLTTLSLS